MVAGSTKLYYETYCEGSNLAHAALFLKKQKMQRDTQGGANFDLSTSSLIDVIALNSLLLGTKIEEILHAHVVAILRDDCARCCIRTARGLVAHDVVILLGMCSSQPRLGGLTLASI
jgi:hypothetical protein